MRLRNWSSVTILTYSPAKQLVNPTYAMLDLLAKKGALGPNVKTLMVSLVGMFLRIWDLGQIDDEG